MTFNNNIPQAPDQMSQSQPQLLENNQAISSVFNLNHVPFNSGSISGMHMFVQFPSGTPKGTTMSPITGQVALYANTYAPTSTNELFFQRSNLGENTGYPITAVSNNAGPFPYSGYTYLPSGIILQWAVSGAITGSGTVTLPLTFTTILWANATVYSVVDGNPTWRVAVIQATTTTSKVGVHISNSITNADGTGNCVVFAIGM